MTVVVTRFCRPFSHRDTRAPSARLSASRASPGSSPESARATARRAA